MQFNFVRQNKPLGLFFIVLGLTMLILFAGELLLRLAVAIVALMLVNHGMKLYGMPSAQQWMMQMWFGRFKHFR